MKRTQQKANTRIRLLEMAHAQFAHNGFLAAKTIDIARSAGISHGALFVHFPTKDELLIAVIEEFGMKMGTLLQQKITSNSTPREVLATHLAMIQEYEPFYSRLVSESAQLPPELRSRVFMIQSAIAHYLRQVIPETIQAQVPMHLLLNSWLGLVHYYLTNRDLFAPDNSVIQTCGPELLNHFINIYQLEKESL
jgi:AcrR family transcriptional regulator